MDRLVTILTVSYPQELLIIRSRLEFEGIECFTKDELTVQAYVGYSNAVGGVKLQVLEEDASKARKILMVLGYLKEEPNQVDILTSLDVKTNRIHLLKYIPVKGRIVLITFLICLPVSILLYFILRPDPYESLTTNNWCVSRIVFKNAIVGPKTIEQVIMTDMQGNKLGCETLDLRENKDIILPGLNSYSIQGNWTFNEDKTITIQADTLKAIYSGKYNVDVSYNELILKSNTTIIYAHRTVF